MTELTEKLFHENEAKTNKLGAWCIFGITAVAIVFGVLLVMGLFRTKHEWAGWILLAGCLIELILLILVRILGVWDRKTKYLVLLGLVFIGGFTYFIYPLSAMFLVAVPVLVSVRYYNTRLTVLFSIIVWLVFILSVAGNIFFETVVPLMHSLHQEQGMTLWESASYTMKYYVIPISAVYAIAGVAGFYITRAGKKLILKQVQISSAAALMSAELDTASKIQKASLPQQSFTSPDGNMQLKAYIKPARNVGGDFYDYFMINDHLLVLTVADVSDKGLPSAMYGVEAQSYLRFAFSEGFQKDINGDVEFINLEKAINAVNRQLSIHNMDRMFVTMWLACIDTRSGVGKFVNAGHCQPYIKRADGSVTAVENEPQFFMGSFEEASLKSRIFRLEDGDSLVLYTDGATDARNAADELFGEERLQAAIAGAKPEANESPSEGIIRSVTSQIEGFIGENMQYDDLTLEVLHFSGKYSGEHVSLELQTGETAASQVIDFVNENLKSYSYPQDFRRNLDVIVDEICDNISNYAYDGEAGPLRVELYTGENYIVMRFTDQGLQFNPLEYGSPDTKGEPHIGGLGIHFVKNLADDVEYMYDDGQNILTVYAMLNM